MNKLAIALLVLVPFSSTAEVLCKNKASGVFLRDACRKNESQFDLKGSGLVTDVPLPQSGVVAGSVSACKQSDIAGTWKLYQQHSSTATPLNSVFSCTVKMDSSGNVSTGSCSIDQSNSPNVFTVGATDFSYFRIIASGVNCVFSVAWQPKVYPADSWIGEVAMDVTKGTLSGIISKLNNSNRTSEKGTLQAVRISD